MPLPFIPVLLGGAAIASGLFGAKKGYDAYCDNQEAEKTNKRAQDIVDESQESLNTQREKTNADIKNFGEYKIAVFDANITKYFSIFEKIKNVEFDDNILNDDELCVDMQEFEKLKTEVFNMTSLLGGGALSLGAVALTGFGAYGGVGLLATASTGTAISTLSGAAATNATLAWLGGGSLASGGLGMAGGSMVLGGLVAGPALAVAGWVMASSAEKAKEDAYTNLSKAKAIRKSNEAAILQLKEISELCEKLKSTIEKLVVYFNTMIASLKVLVKKSNDYETYDNQEKTLVHHSLLMAQSIKNLLSVPLMKENGEIETKARAVRKKSERMFEKIIEIEKQYK